MSTEEKDLTVMELAWLAYRYRLVEAGPCRICGAEMSIGAMGGGRPTVYHCASDAAHWLTSEKTPEEQEAARVHWQRSTEEIASHGDPAVLRLVAEVRRRRKIAGMPVYPEVGETYDPYPYEGSRPNQRYVGNDMFEFFYEEASA